jgi:hypothetical protein
MKYKGVFEVSYRGPNLETGIAEDQKNRHSLEFPAPTARAAYEEVTNNSSETLVQLRSTYMGMTNVEIELLELYKLEPVDLSTFRPSDISACGAEIIQGS